MSLPRRRVERNPNPSNLAADPELCDRIASTARRLIDLTEPADIGSMTLHSLDGCWRISFTKISGTPPGRREPALTTRLPGLGAA